MLPERLTAVLLSLPLLALIIVSISYWITYGKEEKQGSGKHHIFYNRFFLTLVAIGYFGIWPLWVGGIVMLFLNRYYAAFKFLTFSLQMTSLVQIVGLVVLYVGSLFFTWTIGFADKYLRPSISGVHDNHRLVQDGPLGIVRHPYYVSDVLILLGLSLTLMELPRFSGHVNIEEGETDMPRSRPPYSPELRQRILELARAGRTVASLAREFEPTENSIRNWIAQAERDAGLRSDGLTTDERAELTRLRREVRTLREERDILKKAAAWFAQETGASPRRSSGT